MPLTLTGMSRTKTTYNFGDLRWDGDYLSVWGRTVAHIVADRGWETMHVHLSNGHHVRVPLGEARPTAQKLALEMLNREQPRRKTA
jgi:hypothetical protein